MVSVRITCFDALRGINGSSVSGTTDAAGEGLDARLFVVGLLWNGNGVVSIVYEWSLSDDGLGDIVPSTGIRVVVSTRCGEGDSSLPDCGDGDDPADDVRAGSMGVWVVVPGVSIGALHMVINSASNVPS